jgi:hypothetical protein
VRRAIIVPPEAVSRGRICNTPRDGMLESEGIRYVRDARSSFCEGCDSDSGDGGGEVSEESKG